MSNKDFKLLASAANYIKDEIIIEKPEWEGSPFEWVLGLPSGTKGKL